ncbi:gamma-glutamyltransferase [Endozoicomonas sp. G2_1]|uniref:gamma-glutamyltransferase n=1 Tax=Endozoicomonas sp. G2_1 TaxID=2821091 RepID=UPI001ADBF54B|nr:gamma-glutamyltransferase [Endozoicomonas sp. G2_1]MBO9489670.1 gamma-glutamyltransferase [Endozoicomonas sp. G2_1]
MKKNLLKTLLNKSILGSALAVTLISAPLQLQAASHVNESNAIIRYNTIHHPVIGEGGMVSSQRMLASQVGAEILRQGGNAIDAAVATGIALAVTLPRAGNLGGGGFMLVYLAEQDKTVAIDYREMAPAAAHRDMFLDKNGDVDNQKARFSHASSGVPGTVAGLSHALKKYGTMSWQDVVKPSIKLAEQGILVSYDLAENLKSRHKWLTANQATANAYYKAKGVPYEPGEVLVQPDLAWSLKQLAKNGPQAFYRGEIAKKIAADMKKHGGLITLKDLANYKVAEREAVTTNYRGYEVVSMPPTSSGGVHVAQMLNILEHFPLAKMGYGSADSIQAITEAMKLAYADRSEYLGDPDHFEVPIKGLTSKAYAKELADKISLSKATPSTAIKPGNPAPYESPDTTHFSVMDAQGNAVSNTYTLNFSYGSGIVIPGTGILMNNEMDDFSSKPGVPNGFGLIGGEANAIQPTKRPLSSMTPTMIFKDDRPFVITGSPGGSRIITTVLQVLINVMDHDMNIAQAVHAPRIHHQWLPDQLELEPGFSPDTIKLLKAKGQNVKDGRTMGSVQSIMYKDGKFFGVSDPRRPDAGTVAVK